MSTYTIKARTVQDAPVLGDIDHNRQLAEACIDSAIDDGVDLLVFPELFLTEYRIGTLDIESVVRKVESAIDRLATVASDVTTVIGTVTGDRTDLYNSAVVLDDGEHIGTYHKTHLYGEEPSVFTEGSSLPVFETTVGSLGVQICYDVEFPEAARQLTLAGADVLVTPLANMRPFSPDQRVFAAARALENVRPHIVCNRIGQEADLDFFGSSAIVDERGREVVSAGEDVAVRLTAPVKIRAQGADSLQYLEDRRPEVYRGE